MHVALTPRMESEGGGSECAAAPPAAETRSGGDSSMKIRRWDISTLSPASTVLLIGKRGSGKSFLLRDIAWHMRDKIDIGVGMSPTEEASESLGSFLPQSQMYSDFNEPALERIMATQKKLWKRGRGPHVAIFLDGAWPSPSFTILPHPSF